MTEQENKLEMLDLGPGDEEIQDFANILTKSSQQHLEQVAQSFGGDIIAPTIPVFDLAHLVLNSTWHGRSVDLVSTVAAKQGWSVVSKSIDEDPEGQETLKTMLEDGAKGTHAAVKPESPKTFEELLACLSVDLRSLGNAYIEIVRDIHNRAIEFYHVPALTVRKRKGGGFWQMAGLTRNMGDSAFSTASETLPRQTTQSFELFGGGVFHKVFFKEFGAKRQFDVSANEGNFSEDIRANEMIHIRRYHPLSPFYGVPEFISAFTAMVADEAAEKWNLSYFENNRVPRWLFKLIGFTMNDKEKEDFRTYFLTQLRGRPHIPTILFSSNPNAKIETEKLEGDTNEGSFLAYRDKNRDEILAAHGVPPRMLGVITPGALGGGGEGETQRKDFNSFTIQPHQKLLTGWIDKIFETWGQSDKEVKLDSFDTGDSETFEKVGTAVRELIKTGVMSPNEARKKLGLAPITEEWASKYYFEQGGSLVPITDEGIQIIAEDKAEEKEIEDSMRGAKNRLNQKIDKPEKVDGNGNRAKAKPGSR